MPLLSSSSEKSQVNHTVSEKLNIHSLTEKVETHFILFSFFPKIYKILPVKTDFFYGSRGSNVFKWMAEIGCFVQA